MEALDLHPAAYCKSYEVFNVDANGHAYFEKWVKEDFTDILKKNNLTNGGTIKVLSLGCGFGM